MIAYDKDVYQVETIIEFCLMPCILVSNILVFAAPFCWKRLRTLDNILMMNLAVADLITGSVSIPMVIIKFNPDYGHIFKAEDIPCRVSEFFGTIPVFVSLLTLLIMCLDKLIAVTFPQYYITSMKPSKAILAILFIWLQRMLLFGLGMSEYNFNSSVSDINERCGFPSNYPGWYIQMLLYIVISEMSIAAVIATYLLFKVSKMRRELTKIGKNSLVRYYNAQSKGIKINAILIYVFIILWIPFGIVNLLEDENKPYYDNKPYYYHTIVWIPIWVNATLKAPIYAYVRETNRCAYSYMIRTPPWKWNTLNVAMDREKFRRRFSSGLDLQEPGTWTVTHQAPTTTTPPTPRRSSMDIASRANVKSYEYI